MLRILIADDHALIRKGLRYILLEEYPSAIVEEVGDGEGIIKRSLNEEWDIIITDLSMPGINGLDVMKHLKQHFPKLPVLILSVYPAEQYAVRVLKAGAAGYLCKDAATEELVEAVQRILQGRKYISPSIAEKIVEDIGHPGMEQATHELLSDREFGVFILLASGKTVSEIADQWSISGTTVSTYRSRILEKMNKKTNAELTRYALENKLI